MPRLMTSYSERYGLFGVTIALVGWLLCISFILVASTVVAGEFDRAPEAWATRIRYPWTEAQLRPDRTPERSLPAAADTDRHGGGVPDDRRPSDRQVRAAAQVGPQERTAPRT